MKYKERLKDSSTVYRWFAWIILGTTLVINAIAFWMILPNLGNTKIFSWGFLGFSILASLLFITVGTLILNRHPHHIVGWLFSITGWLSSIQAFIQGLMSRYYILDLEISGVGLLLAWILNWIWIPLVISIILIPLFYPNGHLPSAKWRYFVIFGFVIVVIGLLIQTLIPGKMRSSIPHLDNPYGISGIDGIFNFFNNIFIFGWIILFIGAAVSLLIRFRTSHGIERQQIKWFFYATIMMVITAPFGPTDYFIGQLAFILAILFVPVAVGIAILQYNLLDIDLVIRRTILYAMITLTLILIYFGSVVILQWIFTRLTGQGSPIAIVISTLAIAALFTPLRRKLQAFIDQRFYRGNYDAEQTLAHFSEVARDEVEIENLLTAMTSAVSEALKPEALNLWIIDKDTIHD